MTLKERFRQIKKFPTWIYWLPCKILLTLRHVMRHEDIDPDGLVDKYTYSDEAPVAVTVLWHNRLLFFPAMFPKKVRKRTVAVISASRDGQYIADLVSLFGVRSVRGSSSRKAVQVLHGAMKNLKNGCLISFTPDGPRGPKYHMSKGPIHVASSLGAPIIPIAVNYSSYWSLKSWDGFQIPKPWAKITLVMGKEIHIPQNLTDEEMETWRQRVETALTEISHDQEEKKP